MPCSRLRSIKKKEIKIIKKFLLYLYLLIF